MSQQTETRLFDVHTAAVYLNTTVPCIRRLIWSGELTHFRLGKKYVIDKIDLDAYVERRKAAA